MSGVGGVGGLSDGMINFCLDIGGDFRELINDENYVW